MDKPLFFISRIFMLGLALTWWGLCRRVFRRLENRHPDKYTEIGSPSLRWGSSLRSNWSFLKFLWKNEFQPLNDSSLTRTCWIMKYLFAGYCIISLSFLIMAFAVLEAQQP